MSKFITVLLLLTLFVVPFSGCSSQAPQIAKMAPNFKLAALAGQKVSLSDFRGHPVLVNFWATWCPACREEMPYIQTVFEQWADKGLVILAIDIGESPTTIKKFMEDNNLSFPVLLDTSEDVARKYNIRYLPTTFFIDRNGIIQAMKVGAFSSTEELEESLNSILP